MKAQGLGIVAAILLVAGSASADYDTHPQIHPSARCIDDDGNRFDPESVDCDLHGEKPFCTPAGIDTIHCQRLFWDLPSPTVLGSKAIGAPFDEDPIPRFPNGLTDRIPPLYVGADGLGYESECPGGALDCDEAEKRTPICGPGEVTYWKQIYVDENENGTIDPDERTQVEGTLPGGEWGGGLSAVREDSSDAAEPQFGPIFEVACRRGVRDYYGPWQVGTDPVAFDALSDGVMRFENTAILDGDVAAGRTTPDQRWEWSVASEFYNHFASHHGTCYSPGVGSAGLGNGEPCNDPENPMPREAFDPSNPDAACRDYQRTADGPNDPEGEGPCYAGDEDMRCSGDQGGAFRNATQVPGRLSVPFPDNRGMKGVEDQLWKCDHHVVHQLPPGSYSMTKLADYRLQKGGVTNDTEDVVCVRATDTCIEPGAIYGGSVGEMVMQYFTEPADKQDVKPANIMFNAIPDAATTAYPPFSWAYHESHWAPPYDAAIGLVTIHSHHRMVKGMINVTPNPVRLESDNPLCGGMGGEEIPTDLYTNWNWEDAKLCHYWTEKDGPVILRKGQVLRTTCLVNNGITPEAIKHGLVAGSVVEMLRNMGAPIPPPEEVSTVPTSTWAPTFVDSPVGQELLYGTHPPINYRVKYACSYAPGVAEFGIAGGKPCNPNPAIDGDGDYVDGPYVNEEQCGEGGWCSPGTITFANVGEDEMCIGVAIYWALDRVLNSDGTPNEEALAHAENGDVDQVGLPGSTPNMDAAGICADCQPGL